MNHRQCPTNTKQGIEMINQWHLGSVSQVRTPAPVDFKIYCDESCHLQHDGANVMVFGALLCPAADVEPIVRAIKAIRTKYGYATEIKWTKLIAKQLPFYLELVDLFIESSSMRFKATVVTNKQLLDHTQYNQGSHGTFYYKIAYYTLRDFLENDRSYRIHLDYMDTQGKIRSRKLLDILGGQKPTCFLTAQTLRSHESQLIQLCDLLIGMLSYARRFQPEARTATKSKIIEHFESRIARSLLEGTPPWEEKFNIFAFSPRRNS